MVRRVLAGLALAALVVGIAIVPDPGARADDGKGGKLAPSWIGPHESFGGYTEYNAQGQGTAGLLTLKHRMRGAPNALFWIKFEAYPDPDPMTNPQDLDFEDQGVWSRLELVETGAADALGYGEAATVYTVLSSQNGFPWATSNWAVRFTIIPAGLGAQVVSDVYLVPVEDLSEW